EAISGTTPPNGRCAASWLETTEASTRPSPSTSAQAVSSQEVSMLRTNGRTKDSFTRRRLLLANRIVIECSGVASESDLLEEARMRRWVFAAALLCWCLALVRPLAAQ